MGTSQKEVSEDVGLEMNGVGKTGAIERVGEREREIRYGWRKLFIKRVTIIERMKAASECI